MTTEGHLCVKLWLHDWNMEQCHYWETNTAVDFQKCLYYVYKSFSHFPMLSKVNPFDTLPYHFFKIHLLIFSNIYLCLANCLLFRFLHQCHIYISLCCVCVCKTCLCHPACFHCSYNILRGEQTMKLLIWFSLAFSLGPNVFLSTPFSNTLSPCFTLMWETEKFRSI